MYHNLKCYRNYNFRNFGTGCQDSSLVQNYLLIWIVQTMSLKTGKSLDWKFENKLFGEGTINYQGVNKSEGSLVTTSYSWYIWLKPMMQQSRGGTLLKSSRTASSVHTEYICCVCILFLCCFQFDTSKPIWLLCCYGNKKSLILDKACTIQHERAQPSQQCTTGWVSKAHKEMDTDLDGKPVFLLYWCEKWAPQWLSSLLLWDKEEASSLSKARN